MRWQRLLIALAVITAGCNALTGVGDLAVEPSDAGSAPPDAAPVADATVAPTEDAGADVIDAADADAFVADAFVDADAKPPPPPPPPPPSTSCKALLAAAPMSLSKLYMIDPDGPGGSPPFEVFCDMTTEGGGWTQVFAWTVNTTTAGDFTSASAALLGGATSVLLAYRMTTGAVTVATATFPIPADWKTTAPLKAQATDVTVSVSVNGGAATTEVLRYGSASFGNFCTDDWDTTNSYGRICIETTAAPYFDGFASTTGDYCNVSTDAYNATSCVPSRAFSIAVR